MSQHIDTWWWPRPFSAKRNCYLQSSFIFQNTELREETTAAETAITFPWMSISVFTKVTFAATIFAVFKYLGFAIILVIVLIRLVITKVFWKNLPFENNFLGATTSITAPCLMIKENSKYYIVTNVVSDLLSLMFVWTGYVIARLDLGQSVEDLMAKPIFQCKQFLKIERIYRCSNITDPDSCLGLFPGPINPHSFETACPEGSDEWLPLLYMCIILTCLQVLSVFSILMIHYVGDKMNKLKVSLKLNKYSMFPILWKANDQDWQDEAKAYLNGELKNDSERSQNLLKSAINSGGYLELVEVLNLIRHDGFKVIWGN